MKKDSKHGWIKKILHDFDMFKSPANLRINNQPDASQFCPGIFSILLFILFVYVLVTQIFQVLNYNQINSSLYIYAQSNLSIPKSSNILFSVTPAWLSYAKWQNIFLVYGCVVTQTRINETYQIDTKWIQFQLCRREQWENFTQIYDNYGFSQNLCPTNISQLTIQGADYQGNNSYIMIFIDRCYPWMYDSCVSNDTFLQNLTSLENDSSNFYSIYMIDTSISADKQNPIKEHVRVNYDFYYSKKRRENFDIYLGQYYVETDVNLFPTEQKQYIQGYYIHQNKVQSMENSFEIQDTIDVMGQQFGKIRIKMSNKRKKYQRTIGKIDEVFSYVGGLFGILIAFFSFFINSYNEYSYELSVAQSSFNYDEDGQKIKESQFNFIKYTKLQVYQWVKFLFCFQLNWDYDKKNEKTRDQSVATMDVINLYRKIQLIQLILGYTIDKNELDLLYLTKHPTLEEVQYQRLGMAYYNKVIQGKRAVNIEDLKLKKECVQNYKSEIILREKLKNSNIFQKMKIRLGFSQKSQPNQKYIGPNTMKDLVLGEQMVQNRQGKTSSVGFHDKTDSHNSGDRNKQDPNKNITEYIKNIFNKYSGVQDQQIIDQIANLPKIAEQAKKVKLDQKMLIIEQQFAVAYANLDKEDKDKIIDKIPLKILHRLMDCLQKKQINNK